METIKAFLRPFPDKFVLISQIASRNGNTHHVFYSLLTTFPFLFWEGAGVNNYYKF